MAAAQIEEDLMDGVRSYLHIQRCALLPYFMAHLIRHSNLCHLALL